jgi:RHS repeat-associated protein
MTRRLGRLLLALALACLPALAAAAEKLAFVRGTAVYGINGDGTGLQQLSQPPAGTRDFGPLRYSPNAAKIAFQRIDAQSIPQIWVMNANGTSPVRVSAAGVPSDTFSWAPDGTRLAVVANSQLYLVNADGTGLRALTAAPNAVALPSFSPDGTRIAFGNSVGGAASQIYVINADGSGLTNLSQTPANSDVEPVWSPDGGKIAFTRFVSAPSALTGDLYVMNPDGSGKTNLTSTRDTFGSVWSRDGRAIAFTRKTGTSTVDLFTVAPTGGPMARVTTNLQVAVEAAWTSDNSRLALSSGGDLFTVKPDGTGLTNITNAAAAQNFFPEYAPQPRPKQLYFIHPDHLNTPRLIADQNQRTVWRWDQQEPFGVNAPDENPSGLGAFEFPMRFPGQYADKETNLLDNWYRALDPTRGQYLQSDLIGLQSGLNTYAYVFSNPLSFVDLTGLQVAVPGGAIGGSLPGAGGPMAPGGGIRPPRPGDDSLGGVQAPGKPAWPFPSSGAEADGGTGQSAGRLVPPGKCTQTQHRRLQDEVDAACQIPRSCDPSQDCPQLLDNYYKNIRCAQARDEINSTCFAGGDAGHRKAATDARNAANRCIATMQQKGCANCPVSPNK